MPGSSLYDRLGGAFAIAAVIDHFSDAVVKNSIVGQESKNPALREWHTNNLGRLPGLKFMRTLWVCNVAGGPFQYTATEPGSTALGLEEATCPKSWRHTFATLLQDSNVDPLVRQITLGCGAGVYCPSATVTRGQMAAFLVRAFGL